jgi:hypothetical protein
MGWMSGRKMKSGKYGGSGQWLLMNPPSGNSKPMGTSLLGHTIIPLRYGQVDRHKIQPPVRNKKNQMHIFKGFEDQSDTYHDTQTHYLMEKNPLLLQDQAEVALKEKKMGPPGPCSSQSGSRYSMSRTYGPREIISLVIPKLGIKYAYH